jgi:hypothetical protein
VSLPGLGTLPIRGILFIHPIALRANLAPLRRQGMQMKNQGMKKKAQTALKSLFGSSRKSSKAVEPSNSLVQSGSTEGVKSSPPSSNEQAPTPLDSLVIEQERSFPAPKVGSNASNEPRQEIAGQPSCASSLTHRTCDKSSEYIALSFGAVASPKRIQKELHPICKRESRILANRGPIGRRIQ